MYLARLPKFLNQKDYSRISGHERHYSFASQLHQTCDPLPYCRTSPRKPVTALAIPAGQPSTRSLCHDRQAAGHL